MSIIPQKKKKSIQSPDNEAQLLCGKKKKQCPNQPEHPGILVSDTNEELKNIPSLFHKFLKQSQGTGRVNKS